MTTEPKDLKKVRLMNEKVFLSIIIPAYNEESNISGTLSEVAEYLESRNFSCEVIVIDDGSKDATVEIARQFGGKIPNLKIIESSPNGGKGYVLKKAIFQSNGEYVMFMDADSSVSVSELDNFLPLLEEETDVYIASRRVPGAKVSMPQSREILGKVYIFFSKVLLGIEVNDINCGFKLFKGKVAKEVFSKQIMGDWSFDAEVLFIVGKYGYKIKEIPVEWIYKDTSKVRPIRDGINSFISLVKIRVNNLSGKYE